MGIHSLFTNDFSGVSLQDGIARLDRAIPSFRVGLSAVTRSRASLLHYAYATQLLRRVAKNAFAFF